MTYLSSRQNCSVGRIAECIRILTGANISTGFVWCNDRYVHLRVSDNRGYATMTDVLGLGEMTFVMVSDCYPAQLKIKTAGKQIWIAHLLRECEGLYEKYNSKWALVLKSKLEQIIYLTKEEVISQITIRHIESELLTILKKVRGRAHEKVEVFRDRLYNLITYITTCLRNRLVPPSNNMSGWALRNTKVKMRVSSLFRTFHGAQDFAILRSVMDTAILQGKHPFDALVKPEIVVT